MSQKFDDFLDVDPASGFVYNDEIHSRTIYRCEICGAHTNEWYVNEGSVPILYCPGQRYIEHNELERLLERVEQIDDPKEDGNIKVGLPDKEKDREDAEKKRKRQRCMDMISGLRERFQAVYRVELIQDGEVKTFKPEFKLQERKASLNGDEDIGYRSGHYEFTDHRDKKILSDTGRNMVMERPWTRAKVAYLERLAFKGIIRGPYAQVCRDRTIFNEPALIPIAQDLGSDHLYYFKLRKKVMEIDSKICSITGKLADHYLNKKDAGKVRDSTRYSEVYEPDGGDITLLMELINEDIGSDIVESLLDLGILSRLIEDTSSHLSKENDLKRKWSYRKFTFLEKIEKEVDLMIDKLTHIMDEGE